MSEDHQHETPIKTPKQLIIVIVASFVIPIVLIVMLVSLVTGGKKVDEQGMALKPESIAERIKPVAAVNLKAADGPKVFLSGQEVYTQTRPRRRCGGVGWRSARSQLRTDCGLYRRG